MATEKPTSTTLEGLDLGPGQALTAPFPTAEQHLRLEAWRIAGTVWHGAGPRWSMPASVVEGMKALVDTIVADVTGGGEKPA